MEIIPTKRQYNKINRLTPEQIHERKKASMRNTYYKNKEKRLKYSTEYHKIKYNNVEKYKNSRLISSYKCYYKLTDDEIKNICNNDYKTIQQYVALKNKNPEYNIINNHFKFIL